MSCQACGQPSPADARFCAQCGARLGTVDAQTIPVESRPQVMSDLRGEERLVTVVFSDMTESVRRTTGLTAEEATTLVNPLLETMVELMLRYGGRIDRFLGDGVLAVFGVPAAHEDDPFRAVRAALELRERATELGLAVTSGVNTGRVYFGPVGSTLHEELTVMGPTVNLAARLQGKAAAGEVVVGASTAVHLAAAFELTPESFQIKGMDEPVDAFKARRLLDHPDKVRGIEGLRAALVGRDDEVHRLRSGFERRAVLALVGNAGVGKSRLATEFRRLVEDRGAVWLEGRGLQLSESTAFAPVADLFRRHLGPDPLPGLAAKIETLVAAGHLGPDRRVEIEPFLVHLLDGRLDDHRDLRVTESDPEQRLTLTGDAVAAYLQAVAGSAPLVVFFDDLHWSDPLTHTVIRTIADRLAGHITLLLASRPEFDFSLVAPPLAVDRMDLAELSSADSRNLVRTLLDISGIPGWLETGILDRAAGNPFYLEELIRSLIQRGQISRVDGQWSVTSEEVTIELPESVEALLMSRVDRLPDPTRKAAKAASVLDRTFTPELFGALAPGLEPELDSLSGAGILTGEGPGFAFLHALTRQAIYSSLLPSQRAGLHERTGRILEDSGADVEQIAHHYVLGRNHSKAVEFSLKAGERALNAFSSDSARNHLERALGRLDELDEAARPEWRWKIHALLGEVRERMADHTAAREHLQAALTEMPPDPTATARVWRYMGLSHRLEAEMDEAHRALDRAEAVLATASDLDDFAVRQEWIRVQKERAFTLYFGGRGRELPAHNEQLTPVVERFGTAAQQADHLYGQVLSSFVDHRFVVPPSTIEMARRALELAESEANPGRVAEGRFALGFALLWGDQLSEAAAMLRRAVDETTRVGAVTEACRAKSYLAIALRRVGLVDEAETAARDALKAAEALDSEYYLGHSLAVLSWVALRRGETDECTRLGNDALTAWGPLERDGEVGFGTEFVWLAAWPLAAAAWDRGNQDAAAQHLAPLLTGWERPMPPDVRAAVEQAVADPTAVSTALDLATAHTFL